MGTIKSFFSVRFFLSLAISDFLAAFISVVLLGATFNTYSFLALFLIPCTTFFVYLALGNYSETIHQPNTFKNRLIPLLINTVVQCIVFYLTFSHALLVAIVFFIAYILIQFTSRSFIIMFSALKNINTLAVFPANSTNLTRQSLAYIHAKGFRLKGYVAEAQTKESYPNEYDCLGTLEDLKQLIIQHKIGCLFLSTSQISHQTLEQITDLSRAHQLLLLGPQSIKGGLNGACRNYTQINNDLYQFSTYPLSATKQGLKNLLDLVLSVFALIVLSPLILLFSILIVASSKGPIIYSHERVGFRGIPFRIYKFRSMYVGAEENGPELSKKDDKRVTAVGRFMRKTRIDEIPNFINVIKGEMSIVGPRPEREHFIQQIEARAPHYRWLHQLKPGITSLGQVKFGYAGNVDEMLQRLRFDMLYLENISLWLDIKILAATFYTIFRGRGV